MDAKCIVVVQSTDIVDPVVGDLDAAAVSQDAIEQRTGDVIVVQGDVVVLVRDGVVLCGRDPFR